MFRSFKSMKNRLLGKASPAKPVARQAMRVEALEDRSVPAAFTPGNVVVERIGDGVTALTNAAAPVFLDEYTTSGVLVQSIALPTTVNGAQKRLTDSGTASSNGYLSLSQNGQYLAVSGYDSALGVASVAGLDPAATNRVVGRVDASGAADTSTFFNDGGNNNFRSVASVDGTSFWVGTGAGGVRYLPFGNAGASTGNLISLANVRNVAVFNGQLYASTQSASGGNTISLGTVGTGAPTTTGQTYTGLPGFPLLAASTNNFAYFFADLSVGVTGVDTLYVADETALAITKYSLNAGTWTAKGTVGVNADDFRGITGSVNGATVTLFATGDASATTNKFVSIVDTSGYNGTFSATPTVLVTGNPGTDKKVMRGVAFAPDDGIQSIANVPGSTLPYTVGGSALSITGNAATFADKSNFEGGSVTVSFTAGGTANDTLSIADGNGITTSGSDVLFNSKKIGTFSGGTAGGTLTISFRAVTATFAGVTVADTVEKDAVQALLNQISFASSSGVGTRTVQFQVAQIDAKSTTASRSIEVSSAASAPAVSGLAASSITTAGATLDATVDSDGGSGITQRGFVFSSTQTVPTTGNTTPVIVSGTTGPMQTVLSGLSGGTTYYYRAFATNGVGTTYTTPVLTFSTLSATTTTLTTIDDLNAPSGQTITFSGTIVNSSNPSIIPVGTIKLYNGGTGGTLLAETSTFGGSSPNFTFDAASSSVGAIAVGTYSAIQAFFFPGSGFEASNSAAFGSPLVITQPPLTPGNIAVLQADANGFNTTASIVEIANSTAGQTIATVPNVIPISGTGTDAMRFSGSASSTGYVSSSVDGSLLTFNGVNHTTDTTSNVNTLNPRAVGTLDYVGAFVKKTTYTGVTTGGQQTRSSTSLDNTNWFIADQTGIFTNGTSAASPSGNYRGIKSFGNTVYVGQSSSTATDIQVSTISNFTGGAVVGLPGLTNNSTFTDFYLISSGDNGSAFDVLYVVGNSGATVGTIAKYSLVGGAWAANGSYTTTFGGFSIAAADSGAGAVLYVSTGTGATTTNNVIKLADAAGYNQTINITTANNVVLYTAPTGKIVKGVSFTPVDVNTTTASLSISSSSVNFGTTVDFTGTVFNQETSATPVGTVEIRDYATGQVIASTSTITGPGATGSFSISNVVVPAGNFTNLRALFIPGSGSGFGSSVSSSQSLNVAALPFTAGNIAAIQTDEADFNTPFRVIEVNSSTPGQNAANGYAIESVDPLSGALRTSGSATSTSYLSNSNYGDSVVFSGANTSDTVNNVNTIAARGAGSLNANGVYNFGAAYTGTSGQQARGATVVSGSTFYIGDQGGIFVNNDPNNGASSPNVVGNYRAIKSFGNVLYVGSQDATTPLPIVSTFTTPSTVAGLPGLPSSATFQDFYLIQSGSNGYNGTQYDVLYVVSNTSATAGTINKYSLVAGTWVANGSYPTTFGGFGLAAEDDGAGALLYVSTGTGATSGNSIVKLADTAGYNQAINISAAPTTLYTAPAGKILKGVAFTPQNVTPAVPTVINPAVTNIATTSATIGGEISSDNFSPLFRRGVVYSSTDTTPTRGEGGNTWVDEAINATQLGSFSINVSSLTPNTTYYYNVYASNGVGDGYLVSAGQFTTASSSAAPTVNSPTAPAVGSATATLGGTIASDGGSPITARGVIYVAGNSSNFVIGDPGVFAVNDTTSATGPFTFNVPGSNPALSATTLYSYRAYATNGIGTSYSAASTFTTLTGTTTQNLSISPTSGIPGVTSFTFTADVVASSGASAPTAGTVEFRNGGPSGTLLATATASTPNATTRTFTVNLTIPNPGTYSSVAAYYIAGAGFENSNSANFGTPIQVSIPSGPISYATAASTYDQDFDSLPTAATPNVPITPFSGSGPFEVSQSPINGYGAPGWYVQRTAGSTTDLLGRIDDGSTSGGAFSNFGSLSSSDRALGVLAASENTQRIGAVFVNDTGTTLNNFTIEFTGEQWRIGSKGVATPQTISFSYKIGATAAIDDATGFNAVSQLNFTTPTPGTVAGPLDGNAPANRTEITHTISGINWLAGDRLAIRWDDADNADSDDGMAIDDFSFSADVSPPSAPTFTSPASASFITQVASTFTVTAAGVPAPTFSATGLPGWLTLNSTTGELAGTPPAVTVPTEVPLVITAVNGNLPDATQNFTLTILPTVIAYTTPAANYEQNFDGLPSAGTFALSGTGPLDLQSSPINASNIYGWSFGIPAGGQTFRFFVASGGASTGSVYSFGADGNPERALGSIASGSNTSRYGAKFVNETGSTLDSFTISFTGEQWRQGSLATNTLAFGYELGGADVLNGTYTAVSQLDFTSPVTTGSVDVPLDGNLPINQDEISHTVTGITWSPGQTLIIRWADANEDGADDGLAIDDLTFSATSSTLITKLTGVAIDNGSSLEIGTVRDNTTGQGSIVRSIKLTFDGPISAAQAGAFAITDQTNAAIPGLTVNAAGVGTSTLTLTFDDGNASDNAGAVRYASLADGKYRLKVDGSLLTSYGNPVDADGAGAGAAGSTGSQDFTRLFGDYNNNAFVDATDLYPFLVNSIDKGDGDPGYQRAFDYNNNNFVDATDIYPEIVTRIDTGLPVVP